jgi:nitrate/nitrite transport system substrate-binding protein
VVKTKLAGPTSTGSRVHARPEICVGFVPLLDAAPIILARELNYFADEGLSVRLDRQIGWGNVRDKLVYGHLHASHSLVGMPPASVLGHDRFAEPITFVAALSSGGNVITLSRRLVDAGVVSASTLAEWLRPVLQYLQYPAARPPPNFAVGASGLDGAALSAGGGGDGRPAFAHVFNCSTHHYLLREWLAAGGVDPDRDVRLGVLPPPQMAGHMRGGHLDGFCAGEPWGTQAEQSGAGRVVAATGEIHPGHPEKVLAVNRHWLARHEDRAAALVRAVLRGCAFCADPHNAGRVVEVLARPAYLDVPEELLMKSLGRGARAAPRWDLAATFPARSHAVWVLNQMKRWGHIAADTDVAAVARACTDSRPYRRAAESLGLPCPDDDHELPMKRSEESNDEPFDARLDPRSHPAPPTRAARLS